MARRLRLRDALPMKRWLFFSVLFLGLLLLAVAGWMVDGARWLVRAPVRRPRLATSV